MITEANENVMLELKSRVVFLENFIKKYQVCILQHLIYRRNYFLVFFYHYVSAVTIYQNLLFLRKILSHGKWVSSNYNSERIISNTFGLHRILLR